MSTDRDDPRELQVSRDRETVRGWADEFGAVPVRETAAGEEPARFQLVPEGEAGPDQEEAEWDEFLDHLEGGEDVVVYHGAEATSPVEVTSQREIVDQVDDEEIENRLMQGETVTSTITETAVVERVVVEEITVESELVDTEMVDQRVADVELLRRECTNCQLVDDVEADSREYFDVDRYLATVGESAAGADAEPAAGGEAEPLAAGGEAEPPAGAETEPATGGPTEFPFHAEIELEEAWSVTREYLEQFLVESRIVDTDVSEADTLSDYDVDVEGLHHSIVEGGIVDVDRPPEEVLAHFDVESELGEADVITTTFSREQAVEEEILDRMRVRAEISEAELLGMETISANRIEPGTTAGTADASGPATEPSAGGEADRPEARQDVETDASGSVDAQPGTSAGERVAVSRDTIGKDVVDATGEKIGIVTDVREERGTVYVDPQPGIADRIQAALGWGDADDDDYELETEAISRVTDDQVVLRSHDDLGAGERQH